MTIVPENIAWIYTFQPMCSELWKINIKITSVEGLSDSFENESQFHPYQKRLIILNDVIFQAFHHPEVVKIFT